MSNVYECKEFCLTAEVEIGDDDEEIRDDDSDGDHKDKARLHESLQRVLLHTVTLSSCIPPTRPYACTLHSFRDLSATRYWTFLGSLHLRLLHACLLPYVF